MIFWYYLPLYEKISNIKSIGLYMRIDIYLSNSTIPNTKFTIPNTKLRHTIYMGRWLKVSCLLSEGWQMGFSALSPPTFQVALTIYSFRRKSINIFCIHTRTYCIALAKIIWFCRLDNFSNFCCESVNEALRLVMKGSRRWKLIKYFFANLPIALKSVNRIVNLPITLKIYQSH